MVDPAWIGGQQKYVKRSRLKTIALLCADSNAPAVEKLAETDALEYVTEGKYRVPTDIGMSPYETQPFFNPYMLAQSVDQEDLQRRNFHQLFRVTDVYKLNMAAIPTEALASRIRDLMR